MKLVAARCRWIYLREASRAVQETHHQLCFTDRWAWSWSGGFNSSKCWNGNRFKDFYISMNWDHQAKCFFKLIFCKPLIFLQHATSAVSMLDVLRLIQDLRQLHYHRVLFSTACHERKVCCPCHEIQRWWNSGGGLQNEQWLGENGRGCSQLLFGSNDLTSWPHWNDGYPLDTVHLAMALAKCSSVSGWQLTSFGWLTNQRLPDDFFDQLLMNMVDIRHLFVEIPRSCPGEFFFDWLAPLFVGLYIAFYSPLVLAKELPLGTFLATVSVFKEVSSNFEDGYAGLKKACGLWGGFKQLLYIYLYIYIWLYN